MRLNRGTWMFLFATALVGGMTVPPASAALPSIRVRNTSGAPQTVPVTFGQIFVPGDVPAGMVVQAMGAGATQMNAKAVHGNGSLRHGVLTMLVTLTPGEERVYPLQLASPSAGTALSLQALLATSFDATVSLNVGGTVYQASARTLLGQGVPTEWLSGPLCTEWLVSGPVRTLGGAAHPHLQARFAIRAYQGLTRVRADVTVENVWAYEPNPQGFTYDATVTVPGNAPYVRNGLEHTHHARWRRVIWWGGEPPIEFRPDMGYRDYLLSTGAFPYYDRQVTPTESALAGMAADFAPMSNGNMEIGFPNTGAAAGIGPMPRWAALYLLSIDPRARANVLANGNCGGSYQIHYRDKNTDRPVSIIDYPFISLLGNPTDTLNPATGQQEILPTVSNALAPFYPDDAHQPSIAYLPYILTGDYFQLEELQFWANWNMLMAHPSYRQREKGLLKWGQVRAQAWGLRSLGQAAYIAPDSHPLKTYFVDRVGYNLDWYTANYAVAGAPDANNLGVIHYGDAATTKRPWMDDFFTWSTGYMLQLGFPQARTLALFKAKYPVGRMTDPGYCWLNAPLYEDYRLAVDGSPLTTFGAYYQRNREFFPNYPSCDGTVMRGYPSEATGYGANLQPALAAVVDMGAPGGAEAWAKYETRNPKQLDYDNAPQFAVVPRDPTFPPPPGEQVPPPLRPRRLRVR